MRIGKTLRTLSLAAVAILPAGMPGQAAVKMPHMFRDNMVLQRDRPVPVWGWAKSGQTVEVAFGGQEKVAVADADGKWKILLDPLAADKRGRDLTVASDDGTLTFKNVVLGEVWLCSGQSNMDMRVNQVANAPAEIAASAQSPAIRFFVTPRLGSPLPLQEVKYDCG
jgi:sialate O-acetylesterase